MLKLSIWFDEYQAELIWLLGGLMILSNDYVSILFVMTVVAERACVSPWGFIGPKGLFWFLGVWGFGVLLNQNILVVYVKGAL
jgi:hypothetical protein